MARPLHEIAKEARADWAGQTASGRVPPVADAYLRPMETLTAITDNYHMDSAKSVVLYFLANSQSWRGDTARRIKQELKQLAGVR